MMSDLYQNTSESILNGLDDIRAELKAQSISIEIDAAAEYYIDFDFEQKIGKEKFLIFGDNYILVELFYLPIFLIKVHLPNFTKKSVTNLLTQSLEPVYAIFYQGGLVNRFCQKLRYYTKYVFRRKETDNS